jgi:3-hydroxyisobutyrate dehydrogenase
MDKVIDVVGSGAAGNWFLSHRGKSMVAGRYPPGFKLALHLKDLLICQEMARTLSNFELPLVNMTGEHYRQLLQSGFGEEDISALYRLKIH